MFPNNNENPFPNYYSTQTTLLKDHQQLPPFLLHFPSSFLDGQDTAALSREFHPPPPPPGTGQPPGDQPAVGGKTNKKNGASRKRNPSSGATPRVRSAGKKDRHSKICTARGVRDRRMRLSLQIARKFFDLQDMLGFDKASKTIEWLFSKSKNAIKEIMMSSKNTNMNNPSSSDDEHDDVGSIMEENYSNNNEAIAIKESRQRARARARERTSEKKKMMMNKGLENSSHNFFESNPNSSLEQLGSSSNSPFLEESCCQEIRSNDSSNNFGFINHSVSDSSNWTLGNLDSSQIEPHKSTKFTLPSYCNSQLGIESQFASSVGIMEKYLGGASFGASMMEDHQDNVESFMGFLGNLELGGGSDSDNNGAGTNHDINGLASYAGINLSTLYFGATGFELQTLDQEKQFSYNNNS